jgi:chloramphenicol-sensitive protein RarD
VLPLYFHVLAHVPPWLVLCHRVVWSVLFLGVLITFRHEWTAVLHCLGNFRQVALLGFGACLLALNWLIFIYAVGSGQVLQASLGYFINPLVSVAFGMIFMGEKLRSWQWLAVGIAAGGVLNLALRGAGVPWLALSLAFSFALYGLVRKKVDANSLHALLVETVLLLPIAAVVLAFVGNARVSRVDLALLSASGVITAVPLLCFGAAVRRLPLSTIGFLQYIGPTLQFVMATAVFGEALDSARLWSFGFCWLAIGVYVVDSVLRSRAQAIEEPD